MGGNELHSLFMKFVVVCYCKLFTINLHLLNIVLKYTYTVLFREEPLLLSHCGQIDWASQIHRILAMMVLRWSALSLMGPRVWCMISMTGLLGRSIQRSPGSTHSRKAWVSPPSLVIGKSMRGKLFVWLLPSSSYHLAQSPSSLFLNCRELALASSLL